MSKLKQHNYFLFELWVTLRAFPFGLTTLAVTLLVQDKLCLQKYNQSVAYCQSLSTTSDSLTGESTRDSILSDSAKFSEYQNLLQCVPMVSLHCKSCMFTFFSAHRSFGVCSQVRFWTNLTAALNFSWHLAFSVILWAFHCNLRISTFSAGVNWTIHFLVLEFKHWNNILRKIDSYLVLLPSLTYWLTGGMANFFTVSYRYVVITTTKAIRPIKFMLFAFALFLGLLINA